MTNSFFDQLLIDDELTVEKLKGAFEFFFHNNSIAFFGVTEIITFSGKVFNGFNEAFINFPPTYKFILNTNDYVSDRIPSYTV